MNFAKPFLTSESIAARSKIRYLPLPNLDDNASLDEQLDRAVIRSANQAAANLLLGPKPSNLLEEDDDETWEAKADSSVFVEHSQPLHPTIQPGDLVVIFESFDRLDFVYATPGAIYSNRNGQFAHDDFLGLPFGSKLRSRNHSGYGFCHLLRPTPELWTRSLPHRTQVIHELDQTQIVWQLELRPNMVVVESGTGSGATSHALLRTIAPHGYLHTYEFNATRATAARDEFHKHGLDHLVTVYHKDVCGKDGSGGGFDLPPHSVDACILDLPEPWLAIPHAATILKPSARIATYSPCVEQTQQTVRLLHTHGFHSIQTMEYRLMEHYVDQVDYEPPPTGKKPKVSTEATSTHESTVGQDSGTSAKAKQCSTNDEHVPAVESPTVDNSDETGMTAKRKRMLVARPFPTMKGHTAFLTFATAGYGDKAKEVV